MGHNEKEFNATHDSKLECDTKFMMTFYVLDCVSQFSKFLPHSKMGKHSLVNELLKNQTFLLFDRLALLPARNAKISGNNFILDF